MKKLYVNKEACIGCGACVAIDPEHFDFGDDNYSEVISEENIMSEAANNAMASCPTSAISYVDEEDNEDSDCDCKECSEDCCHKHQKDVDIYDNDEYDEAEA